MSFVLLILTFKLFFHFSNKGGEQDIQLTNDKRVVCHYNEPKSTGKTVDPGKRKTEVIHCTTL